MFFLVFSMNLTIFHCFCIDFSMLFHCFCIHFQRFFHWFFDAFSLIAELAVAATWQLYSLSFFLLFLYIIFLIFQDPSYRMIDPKKRSPLYLCALRLPLLTSRVNSAVLTRTSLLIFIAFPCIFTSLFEFQSARGVRPSFPRSVGDSESPK